MDEQSGETVVTGPRLSTAGSPRHGEVLAERYEVQERIAKGPFSLDYRAFDQESEERVLLRVVMPGLLKDASESKHIHTALSAVVGMGGKFLPGLTDADRDGDRLFVVEPWPSGTSLRDVFDSRRARGEVLGAEELLPVVARLAAALLAIPQPWRHGDVRAARIWVDPDRFRLAGPFLLPALPSDLVGGVVGADPELALEFAPEVQLGEATDASDRYGVACVAFEGLVGRLPNPGEAPPPELGILGELIASLLSVDPEGRPERLEPLVAALAEEAGLEVPDLDPATFHTKRGAPARRPTTGVVGEGAGAAPARDTAGPPDTAPTTVAAPTTDTVETAPTTDTVETAPVAGGARTAERGTDEDTTTEMAPMDTQPETVLDVTTDTRRVTLEGDRPRAAAPPAIEPPIIDDDDDEETGRSNRAEMALADAPAAARKAGPDASPTPATADDGSEVGTNPRRAPAGQTKPTSKKLRPAGPGPAERALPQAEKTSPTGGKPPIAGDHPLPVTEPTIPTVRRPKRAAADALRVGLPSGEKTIPVARKPSADPDATAQGIRRRAIPGAAEEGTQELTMEEVLEARPIGGAKAEGTQELAAVDILESRPLVTPSTSGADAMDPRLVRAALGVEMELEPEGDDERAAPSRSGSELDPRLLRAALGVELDATPAHDDDGGGRRKPSAETTEELTADDLEMVQQLTAGMDGAPVEPAPAKPAPAKPAAAKPAAERPDAGPKHDRRIPSLSEATAKARPRTSTPRPASANLADRLTPVADPPPAAPAAPPQSFSPAIETEPLPRPAAGGRLPGTRRPTPKLVMDAHARPPQPQRTHISQSRYQVGGHSAAPPEEARRAAVGRWILLGAMLLAVIIIGAGILIASLRSGGDDDRERRLQERFQQLQQQSGSPEGP